MNKLKFVLYTNPNNVTSAAYAAVGTDALRELKKGLKMYRDSYRIIFEGSGTLEDIQKTKQLFSNYTFY